MPVRRATSEPDLPSIHVDSAADAAPQSANVATPTLAQSPSTTAAPQAQQASSGSTGASASASNPLGAPATPTRPTTLQPSVEDLACAAKAALIGYANNHGLDSLGDVSTLRRRCVSHAVAQLSAATSGAAPPRTPVLPRSQPTPQPAGTPSILNQPTISVTDLSQALASLKSDREQTHKAPTTVPTIDVREPTWASWSIKIRACLTMCGVIIALSDPERCPPGAPQHATPILLMACVGGTATIQRKHASGSPSELFKAIKQACFAGGKPKLHQLKRSIFQVKYSAGGDLVARTTKMFDELDNAILDVQELDKTCEPDDDAIVQHALNNLPPELEGDRIKIEDDGTSRSALRTVMERCAQPRSGRASPGIMLATTQPEKPDPAPATGDDNKSRQRQRRPRQKPLSVPKAQSAADLNLRCPLIGHEGHLLKDCRVKGACPHCNRFGMCAPKQCDSNPWVKAIQQKLMAKLPAAANFASSEQPPQQPQPTAPQQPQPTAQPAPEQPQWASWANVASLSETAGAPAPAPAGRPANARLMNGMWHAPITMASILAVTTADVTQPGRALGFLPHPAAQTGSMGFDPNSAFAIVKDSHSAGVVFDGGASNSLTCTGFVNQSQDLFYHDHLECTTATR